MRVIDIRGGQFLCNRHAVLIVPQRDRGLAKLESDVAQAVAGERELPLEIPIGGRAFGEPLGNRQRVLIIAQCRVGLAEPQLCVAQPLVAEGQVLLPQGIARFGVGEASWRW